MPTKVQRRALTVYVSDEAYDELYKHARQRELIPADAVGTQSLYKYVEWLVALPLVDARPESVRSSDTDMVSMGMSPEWRIYGPRRRHKITLTDDAIVQACAHAVRLGMAFAPSQRLIGAPTFMDADQCVAALMEAVGTGWIEVEDE